jgi:hypothetical protein
VVVPEEGGVIDVRLRVFLAATVAGYVLGPHGEPVENADVQIHSVALKAPPGLHKNAVTDAAGRYEILDVMPSTYRTILSPDNAVDPLHRDLARPLPERGEERQEPHSRYGGGMVTCRLRPESQRSPAVRRSART